MPKQTPLCNRCHIRHFNFLDCDVAAARSRQVKKVEERRQSVIFHRPRDGYRDWTDRLADGTQRVGGTTFAIRRQPGERPGSFRA